MDSGGVSGENRGMTGTALLKINARAGWSLAVTQVVLWCWSTGDGIVELAELHDMSARDVRRLLSDHDVMGEGGRDRAAGISARMLHAEMGDRWMAVERDVVAMAISRSEAALIGMREMLHPEADIEADRTLTVPLLLGLARAIDPDGDEDMHWCAAGRLGRTPDHATDALITTRRLDDRTLLASIHDMSIEGDLLFIEATPRGWMHASSDGGILGFEGHVDDAGALADMVRIEIGRG